MTMKRILLILMSVSLAGLVGCSKKHGDDDEEGQAAVTARVAVKVTTVHRATMEVTVQANGRTDVLRREKVVAPTAGRVVTLKVLEYQRVRKGDLLALILTKESQAAIDGARALLQSAQNDEQRASAQKSLDLATKLQANAAVRATIDGIVASRAVTEGELVAENADLMTIIDPATVVFSAEVPLGEMGRVRAGQRATVRFPAMGDGALPATVEAVSPQSDLQNQTVGVRLRFSGEVSEGLLRPEMAGIASIVTGMHHDALVVARAALLRDDENDAYAVVTVLPDTVAKRIPVRCGAMNDSLVEVTSPLVHEGMVIVNEGGTGLADSTKLDILPAGR